MVPCSGLDILAAAERKDVGSIPAAVTALQTEAKSESARVSEISAHVKNPHVVETTAEPSAIRPTS